MLFFANPQLTTQISYARFVHYYPIYLKTIPCIAKTCNVINIPSFSPRIDKNHGFALSKMHLNEMQNQSSIAERDVFARGARAKTVAEIRQSQLLLKAASEIGKDSITPRDPNFI